MSPLTILDYPLDRQRLKDEADLMKSCAIPYTDPRYNQTLDSWLICKHNSAYAQKIMNDFGVNGKPRFYWLSPYTVLPEHVDNGTACSINFVLSDEAAPVTVEGIDYFYTQALLNTSVPHSVTNGAQERVLFKISLFNISYEQMCQSIKFKKVE
jgi:hypothetical protein